MRVVLMLIVGIILANSWGGVLFWLVCLAMAVVAAAVSSRFPRVQTVFLMLGVFFLGAASFAFQASSRRALPMYATTQKAVVLSEPERHGKVIRCDLLIASGRLEGMKVKASILRDTVENRYRRLHVGKAILFASRLETPTAFRARSHFNYRHWMLVHGYEAQTFVYWDVWRECRVSADHVSPLNRLRIKALQARQHLLEHYRLLGFEQQNLAVLAAMTLGDKSLLSKETKEMYSITGASHVLALSGLHLSILYLFLTFFFGRWRRFEVPAQALLLTCVWGYVFLTGMSVSIIRSAVMLSVYGLVAILHRSKASLNTLSFAALAMLLWNPLVLWDAGFQMSFLSVAAIVVIAPPLYRQLPAVWLSRFALVRWLWSTVCVSIAAQIGTAPLVAYYFGRFSCYFLLTNIVVIPATTAILLLALLMFLAWPVAVLQKLIATVLLTVASLTNRLLLSVSALPGASIDHISINLPQLYMVYAMVFSVLGLAYYWLLARRRL